MYFLDEGREIGEESQKRRGGRRISWINDSRRSITETETEGPKMSMHFAGNFSSGWQG
jgi:hypothetical protein